MSKPLFRSPSYPSNLRTQYGVTARILMFLRIPQEDRLVVKVLSLPWAAESELALTSQDPFEYLLRGVEFTPFVAVLDGGPKPVSILAWLDRKAFPVFSALWPAR